MSSLDHAPALTRDRELLTVLCGDALEKLRELPDESVQCCVTSPPYWGLRDYGTAAWEGGDNSCDHSTSRSRAADIKPSDKQGTSAGSRPNTQLRCKCGAFRIDNQLGLEKTPCEYVTKMVKIFREVRRILKNDGTLWLNLGDSYAGSGKGPSNSISRPHQCMSNVEAAPNAWTSIPEGAKSKDLIGIPWMVAFALRQDGWYLRSDIIWSKPNPMPESVTDRPTKAHEYLFLLSKSRKYFYDAEAIKEDVTGNAHARGDGVNPKAKWKTPDGWDTSRGNGGHGDFHRNGREEGFVGYKTKQTGRNSRQCVDRDPTHLQAKRPKQNESFSGAVNELVDSRNKRSVWTVATAPYPEARFATYPPDLIKPCILAGCPVGGTVIDPFAGSGTTGMVALELGRKAILIELNPDYVKLIHQRCSITPGLALK